MNKIILNYILKGYLKTLLKAFLICYCFGLILNLFEEVEFFKNTEEKVFLPLLLTFVFVPNLILKLLPFIIFISSLWYFLDLKNKTELLSLKVFGYSNFKIFITLAITSFMLGWLVLLILNPISSNLVKFYEKTKAEYSRDLDHLVFINENGLWIKERIGNDHRIISADKSRNVNLKNIIVYIMDDNFKIKEKIYSKSANIENNQWVLSDVVIDKFNKGINDRVERKNLIINSKFTHENIFDLYKNFDTMSFLDLSVNYNILRDKGYSKDHLNQQLNSFLSLPFFLFIMTSIAAILSMGTLKKSNNFHHILAGIVVTILVYYFKDLSIALGQTDRIPLAAASWMPVIALGLLSSVGILQINEK